MAKPSVKPHEETQVEDSETLAATVWSSPGDLERVLSFLPKTRRPSSVRRCRQSF